MIVLQVFHIFVYIKILCYTPNKSSDCITRLLSKKPQIPWIFFPLINIVSNTDYLIFWWLKQSCQDHPPTSYTTVLLKGVGWKFWEWLFYKNMKDTLYEDLPYMTHFAVFQPFRRRRQILLTFIRHLTLTKSKLSKRN